MEQVNKLTMLYAITARNAKQLSQSGYMSQDSRTQQLVNLKLLPKLTSDVHQYPLRKDVFFLV